VSASPPPGASAPGLLRAMGRFTLAALVINAILGSGIFGLPAVLARLVGRDAIWAWVAGALGNAVVIACFAEVASRFRDAGGAYLYARTALPRPIALQVGWLAFLTRLTAAAAGANLFTVNLAELLPAASEPRVRVLLLVGLVGGLSLVNLRGVEAGAGLSNLFTVAKLLPLLAFLLAGAWFFATAAPAPERVATATAAGVGSWLQAVLLVVFAFGGFDGAMIAMGEARDPQRDAPFALAVAMLVLTALYGGIQLVVDAVLANPAVSERPLVDAANVLFGPGGGSWLAAGALVSIVGFLGANLLSAPRLAFALAEHRDLPAVFARVHPRFRTPHWAIALFAVAVLGLAIYGNFEWNATLSALARLFVYGATCVALVVLRRRDPAGARVVLPGGPWFAATGLAFCALLATRLGPRDLAMLGVLALLAMVHYAAVRGRPAGTSARQGA
jgi:APA family basic amino acid/polyamine antiporter